MQTYLEMGQVFLFVGLQIAFMVYFYIKFFKTKIEVTRNPIKPTKSDLKILLFMTAPFIVYLFNRFASSMLLSLMLRYLDNSSIDYYMVLNLLNLFLLFLGSLVIGVVALFKALKYKTLLIGLIGLIIIVAPVLNSTIWMVTILSIFVFLIDRGILKRRKNKSSVQ